MLKISTLLLLVWLGTAPALAQDTLVFRSAKQEMAKVLEINPTEVKYKRFDNLDGPLIIVLKAEVAEIRYANGSREVFEAPPATAPADFRPVVKKDENTDFYLRGREDARMYYKGHGAMWGTFAATAYPPVGLLTGVIVGAVPPNPRNFHPPQPELLRNPAYLKGFQRQAHLKKVGKSAAGFGLGVAAFTVISILVLAASVP